MDTDLLQALEEQIKMLKDIIINMPGHVYWTDKNGVYLGCNALQAKSAGCSVKDFIGKTARDMPWLSKNKISQENIAKTNERVLQGEEICIEEEVTKEDGTQQVFLSNKRPLYNSEKELIGMVGVSVDITERKQKEFLEKEQQKNLARISAQNIFKDCINNIYNSLDVIRLQTVNKSYETNHSMQNIRDDIYLTKREDEILYLLDLGKKPKQIANILSKRGKTPVTVATINAIINKQLYKKFGVIDHNSLVEKARRLNLVPFLHDSFLDLI